MNTSLRSLVLLTALGLAACTVETVNTAPPATPAAPPPAAAPAAPAAAPTPAPTSTTSTQTERGGLLTLHPTPTQAATATPAAAPPPAPAADPNSLEPCCAALSAVKNSGRGADAKTKSAQAAQVCGPIARLVKDGKTSKAAALAQIKSALTGVDVPAECQ